MEKIHGRVGVPSEYFLKMAKQDYSNYREALAREFYQNSIDAGASRIGVSFVNDNNSIIITDDGCGMTKDVILNKLLVLGGSHKAEGSVGAFGKAKELLFFSWLKYEIRTNEWLVTGHSDQFSLEQTTEVFNGTKITIWVPEEEYSGICYYFSKVAERMETKAAIVVDGTVIESTHKRQTLLKSTEFGDFYLQNNIRDHQLHVRINGIWMFSRYIGNEALNGRMILEMNHSSLECLTSNRDSMKYSYQTKLDSYVKDIIVDTISFLKPETKRIKKILKGIGPVKVSNDELKEKLNEYLSVEELARLTNLPIELLADRIEKLYQTSNMSWAEVSFFSSYKPDFVLSYEAGQSEVVDKFIPTKRAETLALLWTETIRQILIDNDITNIEFTAGFTFDDEVKASIEGGNTRTPIIYLNPFKIGRNIGLNESNLLSKRNLLIECMKDSAIHELAHLASSYHGEAFVVEMERLRANTHGKDKNYRVISKIKI